MLPCPFLTGWRRQSFNIAAKGPNQFRGYIEEIHSNSDVLDLPSSKSPSVDGGGDNSRRWNDVDQGDSRQLTAEMVVKWQR